MMITVDHVLSTRLLPSGIFDDLYRRLAEAAPDDVRLSQSIRPHSDATLYHYHRPHRERRLRANSIVTIHHDPRERHPWLRIGAFLPRWREAARIICLNQTQVRILGRYEITKGVEIIPHGVDRAVFPVPVAPRLYQGGPVRLGMISKRYDRGVKGEARLEALMAGLDPTRFSFVFAGQGRWHEAALARSMGFAAECFDNPPYALFGQIYQRMDALLILSDFEGGPACLPEAVGSGLPVIATPVGMVPDWIVDGTNGILLTGDTRADAARVAQLGDDVGLTLDHLSAGAFASARTVPGWDWVARRHYEIYRALAADSGRSL